MIIGFIGFICGVVCATLFVLIITNHSSGNVSLPATITFVLGIILTVADPSFINMVQTMVTISIIGGVL
jgi:hypothetical protein